MAVFLLSRSVNCRDILPIWLATLPLSFDLGVQRYDNMSTLELVLNMLAEATTTEISKTVRPETFEENQQVARRGGGIAGDTRKAIEAEAGRPVITSQNAVQLNALLTDMIEGVIGNSGKDKE